MFEFTILYGQSRRICIQGFMLSIRIKVEEDMSPEIIVASAISREEIMIERFT